VTVEDVIRARGIREILHFTTNCGLLGMLATRAVKSRKRLPDDAQLEFLFLPNTDYRKDPEWIDYVNLSISKVNNRFLNWSRQQPRQDRLFWSILSFSPEILLHRGVCFATTNNIYTGVKRGMNGRDLDALFQPTVHQWGPYYAKRSTSIPEACPTCEQAEVLYPGELSLAYLGKIYVTDHNCQDEVHAMIGALGCQEYAVHVDTSKFGQ
jgi:hypothetical protein